MATSRKRQAGPAQFEESPRQVSTRAWIRLAAHPRTVRRALLTALVVGVALIAINHGPAILRGEVTRARVIQMCLTILVPYFVSTVSSVSTRRELGQLHSSATITPSSLEAGISKEKEDQRQAE